MSGYAHKPGTQDTEHPYSDLTASAVSRWNNRLSIKQIPLATSGWDGRPRIENPVSLAGENPGYYQDWYVNPNPRQLADHVRDAINFL